MTKCSFWNGNDRCGNEAVIGSVYCAKCRPLTSTIDPGKPGGLVAASIETSAVMQPTAHLRWNGDILEQGWWYPWSGEYEWRPVPQKEG